MGQLLVVSGPPRAGKSTVARILADRLPVSVVVEGDAFFGFLGEGMIEPWTPDSRHQNDVVLKAATAATRAFVDGGYDAIYDGVVGPWSLPVFTAGVGAGVGRIDYAVLLPPLEVCLERVVGRTGHGFKDEAATEKMHREFTTALATIADGHVFRNDGHAERTADRIQASSEAGRLAVESTRDLG